MKFNINNEIMEGLSPYEVANRYSPGSKLQGSRVDKKSGNSEVTFWKNSFGEIFSVTEIKE